MYCLDTNIVVFALNRRRPALAQRLDAELNARTRLIVPVVVLFELDYGIAKCDRRDSSRATLDSFLAAGFETPAFDAKDAREAGDIRADLERRGTPIGPYDIFIAAQARRRGAALVTLNRREFSRIPGLLVADWES